MTGPAPAGRAPVSFDRAALQAWFEERAAGHAFSGVAHVRFAADEPFTFAAGLAHRGHRVPVRPDTRFVVASISKLTTAVAALRLVDRGLVGLDARIVDVLTATERPTTLRPEVTLHHLLAQTSGIANYYDDEADGWDAFVASWDRIPTYRVRRPADLLPLFVDRPPVFEPGERFAYSDANFVLVGLLLERLTGRTYAEAMRTEVFEPAGMTASEVGSFDDEPTDLASSYVTSEGPPETWRSNVFMVPVTSMPDGGLIAPAGDLVRLVDAIEDGRLLPAELADRMRRPQGPATGDEAYGYGCWLRLADGEVVAWGHGGYDPGISALLGHYPATGTTLVVIGNDDRSAWEASRQLAAALGVPAPAG